MNIGEAAEKSHLPAKTLRYYEEIALVKPARSENGYRRYSKQDIHRLRFLERARRLGFSIAECRQLLSLYGDKDRASADVKAIAARKIAEIDRRIDDLMQLKAVLDRLVETCHGDNRPDCPIIDGLSGISPRKADNSR